MAYVTSNFKTKKAFKDAVKAGEEIYVMGDAFGGNGCYTKGKAAIEGPWYPQPHTWYASVTVDEENKVVSVK